jgi:hypothetical protein
MRRVLAGLVVAAVTVVAAACGGDDGNNGDPQSLEDYLRDYDRLGQEFSDRAGEISDDLNESEALNDAEASVDDLVEAFRRFMEDFRELVDEGIDRFGDLDPPPDAEDAHEDQLDDVREARDRVEEFLDDLAAVDTEEELGEFAERFASGLDELQSDGCQRLQDLADDANIDIDLECE